MLFSSSTGGFYDATINKSIPADAVAITSAEYAALLAGQSEGKRITSDAQGRPVLAAALASGVPQVVSKFQAKAALHAAGLLASVDAMMADPATPTVAKLAWTDAQEFRRTSPTVAAMAGALGLDDAALDALFTAAAGIEA